MNDPTTWLPTDRRLTPDEAADLQARYLHELVVRSRKQDALLGEVRLWTALTFAAVVCLLAVAVFR